LVVAFFIIGASTKASAHVFEISDRDGTAVMVSAEAADLPCGSSCKAAEEHPLAAISERAITRVAAPAMPDAWRGALITAASKAQISPELLAALVHQESGWRTGAHSPRGAIGLAQLMPKTARQLGVDPLDPASNLLGGARYLRDMLDRFGGDVALALAAYNAGPTRVSRAHGVPAIAETRAYVNHVLERLTEIQPTAIQGILP
jgi:soluble lytic murein transglycosylase-like protein